MTLNQLSPAVLESVRRGMVIPAHPLALDAHRRLDERHQRALTRYYLHAGAGGVAVGVHTTQFAIRDPSIGLLDPVLTLASETIDDWSARQGKTVFKVAGLCGRTTQAMAEARLALERGYHAGLLSLTAFSDASQQEILTHCRELASVIPLIGFYLQPAVGGRRLPYAFWRQFVEIDNVLAIKIAPFDRYDTLDVVRAVWESRREPPVALYTGNDDQIVLDLLTAFRFSNAAQAPSVRIVGGLLGHWAVWTRQAVALLETLRGHAESGSAVPARVLTLAQQITDANAALFDTAHGFRGCIAGVHEILRRQGLLAGRWCLDKDEDLSPGQMDEIDRIYRSYPGLNDDAFVADHLDQWLA